MLIGTCLIELHIPESQSLKNKRQIIRSLKDRISNKFNVSIAEVNHQDLWQRSAFGIAMVSNEYDVIERTMNQIETVIQSEPRVIILDVALNRL